MYCFLSFWQSFIGESALAVSLDVLRISGRDDWVTVLTCGSNSQVIVFEMADGKPSLKMGEKSQVSDNVSCVKTIVEE